jgi:pimeloyl-ACP methyl ester carboxylesterase
MNSTTTPSAPAHTPGVGEDPLQSRGHLGWIVASSLTTGLVVALLLFAAPFIPAEESAITGAVLCGFALGWAMLALLSIRFTDQPQRWAIAPALFMGLGGLLLVVFGSSVHQVLGWVWPPALLALIVGMAIGIHRQLRSRAARWLLYPVIAMLAISAVGGGYETVSESLDASAYPAPGQLIDVGGHRLHLHCTGSGSPTVVLEPGGGASSSDFAWIAPVVARDTTVCVYDRAGRGWSDATDSPQDATHIASDLHTLLDRADVPGPYVLAGHSFGGLYVQSFAAQFPDQVAGMVLLDSTAPKPGPPPTDTQSSEVVGRLSGLVSAVAHLGVGRLIAQVSSGTLPPRAQDEADANASTAGHLASFFQEFLAEADTSMHEASSLTTLGSKPLVVVTADEGISDGQWQAKQDRMATLSTNSLHRHANATHESLLDNEADSAAASQAIRDVVNAIRNSRPLS